MTIENREILIGAQAPFILKSQDLEFDSSIDRSKIARSFYDLGKVYYDKAALGKAHMNFEKALGHLEYPRDVFLGLKTYGFLIRIASELLLDEKASEYVSKAESLTESFASVLGSLNAECFYNIGAICNYKGDFASAKKNYLLACKFAKEENEPELLAKCLLSVSRVSLSLNELPDCQEHLTQLGQLLTIIEKDYISGSMNFFLGRLNLTLGKNDLAIKYFDKANDRMRIKKSWNMHGQILLNKGRAYKNLGEFSKALMFFELSDSVVDSSEFKRLSAIVRNEIDDVNDSSVDLYLDRINRKIKEKDLGIIDFKHRFVLLEILFLLATNIESCFDKERLAKAIWKDEYNPLIHDKLIYTSISRLRRLIEPKTTKSKRKYIIRGKDGYTFNPHVRIRFHSETSAERDTSIANIDMSSPV
ncbi:MAG: helix-turn-helix domain-containing protein [Bacteriovoracaceae bacterium]|nr:helix-turn-helix domain-containing protein [Bacteriovoracaceae bacterium]